MKPWHSLRERYLVEFNMELYPVIQYFLKTLCSPLQLCIWFFVLGLILLWFSPKQRMGKLFVTTGLILLLFFSTSFFPGLMLGTMEKRYSFYSSEENKEMSDIKYIAVLAGGFVVDSAIPITSNFSYEGFVRLMESIRLQKKHDKSRLIFTGGSVAETRMMKILSIEMGVPNEKIILEEMSRSTYEEAVFIKSLVNNDKFILVTSASHMPRAMALFRGQGMNPVPAPTGHYVKGDKTSFSVLSHDSNLKKSYIVAYESIAYLKEKLLGRIQ